MQDRRHSVGDILCDMRWARIKSAKSVLRRARTSPASFGLEQRGGWDQAAVPVKWFASWIVLHCLWALEKERECIGHPSEDNFNPDSPSINTVFLTNKCLKIHTRTWQSFTSFDRLGRLPRPTFRGWASFLLGSTSNLRQTTFEVEKRILKRQITFAKTYIRDSFWDFTTP